MDNEQREKLIRAHMSRGDVIAVQIWRRTPSTVELDELKALAYSGLCNAANAWEMYCAKHGYDPERIEFFTPYVVRRMQGTILDALRKSDWLSKAQRATVKRIQSVAGDIEGKPFSELAALAGMTEDEVRTSLTSVTSRRPVSFDAGTGIDVEVEDEVESRLLRFLTAAVGSLESSEQAVLALHYFAGLSLPEIASQLNRSLADIKALHVAAITAVYDAAAFAAPTMT